MVKENKKNARGAFAYQKRKRQEAEAKAKKTDASTQKMVLYKTTAPAVSRKKPIRRTKPVPKEFFQRIISNPATCIMLIIFMCIILFVFIKFLAFPIFNWGDGTLR